MSCKGVRYYSNKVNPVGLSIILQSPSVYYYNIDNPDSIEILLINHNSSSVILPHWWSDVWIAGKSRFYGREIFTRPQPIDLRIKATTVESGDTVSLIKIPLKQLLGTEKTWIYKNKPHYAPHLITQKSYFPYIQLAAEYRTTIPDQTTSVTIRSAEKKIVITTYNEPVAKSKTVHLSCLVDQSVYNIQQPSGSLTCKINNIGSSSIQLFNDAGSVRFKIYAYNPNRTAIMWTEMVLDNGKLPVTPLVIQSGKQNQISVPMEQLFYINPPDKPIFYWTWKRKRPPVSPLIYGKSDLASETECWFGIVVDGKEYLSNTVYIKFKNQVSKKKK